MLTPKKHSSWPNEPEWVESVKSFPVENPEGDDDQLEQGPDDQGGFAHEHVRPEKPNFPLEWPRLYNTAVKISVVKLEQICFSKTPKLSSQLK